MQPETNEVVSAIEFDDFDAEENDEPLSEVSTRMMTIKYLLDEEWSTALGWSLKNGSIELISKVATKVLKHAGAETISRMRIFDAMSDAFLATPELVILYKFYTYKRSLYRGEIKEAMVSLHELFVDNSSPPEFHAVLYHEMITLLKGISETTKDPQTALPSLNKSAVVDLLRSISAFELQQKVRLGGDPTLSNLQPKINREINQLLSVLRPMLCSALVTDTLS